MVSDEAREPRRLIIIVPNASEGRCVGDVLRGDLHMSRRGIIHAKYTPGGILLDDEPTRTNVVVRTGQELSVLIGDTPGEGDLSAEDSVPPCAGAPCAGAPFASTPPQASALPPLDVLYEDEDVLAVNKPAGVVMYPGSGREPNTLGNMVLDYLNAQGGGVVLHPVHRLDRGTSGVVLFAKNPYAQARLSRALHTQDFLREYTAYCWGTVDESGRIERAIARIQRAPSMFGIVADDDPQGKYACTDFRRTGLTLWNVTKHAANPAAFGAENAYGPVTQDVSGAFPLPAGDATPLTISRVSLRLLTGRTHQIRLHMASCGWPLLGDSAYGLGSGDFGQLKIGVECLDGTGLLRPALHSALAAFVHPVSGKKLCVNAPLPADLQAIEDMFR